jgi:hypothetical protein
VLAIVVIGIVATVAALVLLPAGLLAAWGLRALPARRMESEKLP